MTSDAQELPLTLDIGLAPALEVNESKRRQAESIFEKEQDYLVEGFELERKKGSAREPEVYVNDHGSVLTYLMAAAAYLKNQGF